MWNNENYEKYISELFEQRDEKYAEFNKRSVKTKYEVLGIRLPILQKEAKKLAKDYSGYLDIAKFDTFEEVMLFGLVVANIKDYNEYIKYLKKYIPKIDSWALVDSMIPKSKVIEKNLDKNFKYVLKLTRSKKEFESRIGYIMILDYYISEVYLEKIFEIMDLNENTAYYNEMAMAWLIAEMLVKYYDETVEYLRKCKLDKFTFRDVFEKSVG